VAITNGYCTLAELKEALFEGTTSGTVPDSRLEQAVETASRKIETHCGRRFWKDTTATARVFRALSDALVRVDDFWSLTTVEVDLAATATWSTVSAPTLQSEPLNGVRDGVTWAYTALRIVGQSGTYFPMADSQALVRVTAKWGWPEIPSPIRDACIIQAVAGLAAPGAKFGVAGIGDMGVLRIKSGLHPTAQEFCSDYVRSVAIG
jgi:hypothetical protein